MSVFVSLKVTWCNQIYFFRFPCNKGVELNNILSYFQLWHSFIYSFFFLDNIYWAPSVGYNAIGSGNAEGMHSLKVTAANKVKWLCWDDIDRNSKQTIRTSLLPSSHLLSLSGFFAGKRQVLCAQSYLQHHVEHC